MKFGLSKIHSGGLCRTGACVPDRNGADKSRRPDRTDKLFLYAARAGFPFHDKCGNPVRILPAHPGAFELRSVSGPVDGHREACPFQATFRVIEERAHLPAEVLRRHDQQAAMGLRISFRDRLQNCLDRAVSKQVYSLPRFRTIIHMDSLADFVFCRRHR